MKFKMHLMSNKDQPIDVGSGAQLLVNVKIFDIDLLTFLKIIYIA